MRITLPVKMAMLVAGFTVLGVLGAVCLSFLSIDSLRAVFVLVEDHHAMELERAMDVYWAQIWKFALLMALILSVFSLIAVRRVMRPIQTLTQVAQRIAAGEEGLDPPVSGRNDVGELSIAFQAMLNRLRHSHAAMRELTVSLEEQVRQRTSDLAVARDEAVAASHAKSEFLAIMSHEIRTPMNVVLGMLELLRDAPLGHDRMEQVRLAHGSGKTLLALIDNVLDFSKIEARHLTLDEVDFDLRALIDESALTLAIMAHSKGIELTSFFPHGMPTAVRGDMNRLRQILTNLLGNAIKFTPEGGTVEVHGGPIGEDVGEKTEYLFEVRDTGPGVPLEEQERIFDHFVQLETIRRHGHPGAGLGLTISKHLVEMMGGEIGVDVNPNAPSGSVFYFTVKLTKQPTGAEMDAGLGAFKGLRVLGVEIDGLQRIFLEDVFALFGVRFGYVAEVETALEALRQAKQSGFAYDVVVVNQKPGQNSQRVFRQLRQAEPGPRFILLTDMLDQGLDRVVDLPGFAICLKKPVSAERLRSALDWLLEANGEQGQLAVVAGQPEAEIPLRYTARVLVVDDHAANLTVARGMLVRLGCDPALVVTAVDGREGVARFQEEPFQLVFMDCQMPGMDGYEASRLIRGWEQEHQRTPATIVAFTANVTTANRQLGQMAGMNDFLAKPVTLGELRSVLERFLSPQAYVIQSVAAQDVQVGLSLGVVAEAKEDLALLKSAMESIGLPEEDFRDVAELLASQLPELLGSLTRDLHDGEYESARATAHVLKGSMANTIFPQLQTHTRVLYEKIKEKSWQDAQMALHVVQSHFVPVQRALEAFLVQGLGG